jgi:hypothetical protein
VTFGSPATRASSQVRCSPDTRSDRCPPILAGHNTAGPALALRPFDDARNTHLKNHRHRMRALTGRNTPHCALAQIHRIGLRQNPSGGAGLAFYRGSRRHRRRALLGTSVLFASAVSKPLRHDILADAPHIGSSSESCERHGGACGLRAGACRGACGISVRTMDLHGPRLFLPCRRQLPR